MFGCGAYIWVQFIYYTSKDLFVFFSYLARHLNCNSFIYNIGRVLIAAFMHQCIEFVASSDLYAWSDAGPYFVEAKDDQLVYAPMGTAFISWLASTWLASAMVSSSCLGLSLMLWSVHC